jgi:hypothetical protein
MMEKGKIPGKPEDLETTNLVDIYNAGHFYTAPSRAWVDNTLPVKKGDPGRPVIPISIGAYTFEEAICDNGSSVNIMPKVIYEKIHGEPLLYTTMCLQLANQTPCYPKGILEDVSIRVRHSFVPVDFVVVETDGDDRAPIILGRPFLSTAKAIIYVDSAKICFTINDSKERFDFKKHTLKTPAHPQTSYIYEDTTTATRKNNNRRKNKAKQPREELVWMVSTVESEIDHHLPSPYLTKLNDPGVSTIDCMIGKSTFYKTFCNIGSNVNIMSTTSIW